jgi:hypothetical protein
MPRPPIDKSLARALLDKPDELARVLDRFMRQTSEAFAVMLLGDSAQAQLHRFNVSVPATADPIFAEYKTTAGQSCTGGGAFNLVNYETAVVANPNVTTGAAWKFTAPRSSDYDVSCLSTFANTYAANTLVLGSLFVSGADTYRGAVRNTGNAADFQAVGISTVVRLTAGQYIDWRAYNRSAGAVLLDTNGANNWIRIRELVGTSPIVGSCWPYDFACTLPRKPSWVGIGEVREQSANFNVMHGGVDWDFVIKQTAAGPAPHIRVRNIPLLAANRSYQVTLLALWE